MAPEYADRDDDIAPSQSEEAHTLKRPGSKAQGRKRTKTGCLTCRKRRIKCGEERPTCHNCTKSRRQCEGYNQRVVFKDPLSSYRPPQSTTTSVSIPKAAPSQPAASRGKKQHGTASFQTAQYVPSGAEQSSRPLTVVGNRVSTASLPPAPSPEAKQRSYASQSGISLGLFGGDSPPSQSHDTQSDAVDQSYLPELNSPQLLQEQAAYYNLNAPVIKPENQNEAFSIPAQGSSQASLAGPNSSLHAPQELFEDSNRQFPAPAASAALYRSCSITADSNPINVAHSNSNDLYDSYLNYPSTSIPENLKGKSLQPLEGQRKLDSLSQVQPEEHSRLSLLTAAGFADRHLEAIGDSEDDLMDDDDPFDVLDDEDTPMEEHGSYKLQQAVSSSHFKNDLGILVALQAGQDSHSLHPRSFTSFIDRPDMLATYVPSFQASPLNDSMTAKLFCHFVNVTGPSISMYDRNPANPSLLFQGYSVPASQQHMWTYTIPTLALQNPPLLHAILSLASLHIARLQGRPATASLKHYHISLRRTAKYVGLPTRRGQPGTLAAILILGFYECWIADHQKWSNHLLGAKQLLREIDFAGMSRHMKALKIIERQEALRDYKVQQRGMGYGFDDNMAQFQTHVDDVDENLVALLMGKKILHDEKGKVMDENAFTPPTKSYTRKDLELFATQCDLFWWYRKQDAYQSLLGGGRLFMEYTLWGHCPPRGPLGRLNAVYATFDHIILLLGRIGDFSSKDLKRKRLVIAANGGWRPPAEAPNQRRQGEKSASQGGANPSGHKQQPKMPPMPDFSGMVPGVGKAKLPMGFEPLPGMSPQSTESEDIDLEIQTIEAEEEWQDIRNALSILKDHLGEEFQALGPEFCETPIQTPFGTALQYRTYGIAGIWINFYAALIACYRAHPSMPPAALVAAGVAARQTGSFANEIGRIVAGICPDSHTVTQINPGIGAVLIEATIGIFIAGVQYQSADQRAWTTGILRDVFRLTGWQTALAVVGGCESSWIKAGELGRGAPYTRTYEIPLVSNVWNQPRRVDRELGLRDNPETKMVVSRYERVHFALGLLGVEDDFENLNVVNDEGEQGV